MSAGFAVDDDGYLVCPSCGTSGIRATTPAIAKYQPRAVHGQDGEWLPPPTYEVIDFTASDDDPQMLHCTRCRREWAWDGDVEVEVDALLG